MSQLKVSIVIPIYNAQPFLTRCLTSIQEQSYPFFEVIMVNDGSIDNSELICKDFEKKDARFNYIKQNNKGVSHARNIGISCANGYYLTFIDADDYIEKNFLEVLLNGMKNDVGISICGYKKVSENSTMEYFYEDGVWNNKSLIDICFKELSVYGYSWNKLFLTDIIKEKNILYNDKVFIAEDLEFLIEYLIVIDKGRISKDTPYMYIHNDDSAIGSYISKDNFMKKITILQAYENILMLLPKENESTRKKITEQLVKKSATYYRIGKNRDVSEDILDSIKLISQIHRKKIKLGLKDTISVYLDLILPSISQKIHFILKHNNY